MILKIVFFIWLFIVVFGIILQFSTIETYRKSVLQQQSKILANLNHRLKLLRDIDNDITNDDNQHILKLVLKLTHRLNVAINDGQLNKAIDINNQLEKQVHQLVANDMDGFMQDAPLAKLIREIVSLQTKLITLRNQFNQSVVSYNRIIDGPSNILVKTIRKLQPFKQLPKVDQVDTQDIQQITQPLMSQSVQHVSKNSVNNVKSQSKKNTSN